MTYEREQRVELVHTDDPYTKLRPGSRGTVTRYEEDGYGGDERLSVQWDSGSTLTLLLNEGDAVRVVEDGS